MCVVLYNLYRMHSVLNRIYSGRENVIEIVKAMEKIEKETCIRFEDRGENQHQDLVSFIIST